MGIILNESRQYDFLKRTLPHYERTLPGDYRVELNLRGSRPQVLQAGKKPADLLARAPVLRFEFIDSADNLNYIKIN